MGGRGANIKVGSGREDKIKTWDEIEEDEPQTYSARMRKKQEEYWKNFNAWRFDGIKMRNRSNKYLEGDQRVSLDGNKIIVNINSDQVKPTMYGYMLILDKEHIMWLKDWQVSDTSYGTEVILNKQYFNPKVSKYTHEDYADEPSNLKWETWKKAAEEQEKRKAAIIFKKQATWSLGRLDQMFSK